MVTVIDTLAARRGSRHPLLDQPAGCGGSCSTPPAGPARRGIDAPPVIVDGWTISEAEIAREMQHHEGASIEEARAAAAQALVIRHLLLKRAAALGLVPAPETDSLGRFESDEEALVRQVLEVEAPPSEPTSEECRRVHSFGHGRWPESFEAAEPIIRDRLRARAWISASAAYVTRLARAARVEGINLFAEGPP